MKIKPMPFNADMTKAIWEDRKTVTRRPVKPQPPTRCNVAMDRYEWNWAWWKDGEHHRLLSPYYPGDICYVPEAWKYARAVGAEYAIIEFRDGEDTLIRYDSLERAKKWRKYLDKPKDHWQSPYFMPREAARLFLRVTDVRVERLQDIDGPAAEAEGALVVHNPVIRYDKAIYDKFGKKEFAPIWDSTVKPKDRDLYGWAANPWVWVIKFERISREEAMKAGADGSSN